MLDNGFLLRAWLISSVFSTSIASAAVCDSPHRPELTLQKLKCDLDTRVVVVGEIHSSKPYVHLEWNAMNAAENGQLYAFFEGYGIDHFREKGIFGLEDPFVYNLSMAIAARRLLFVVRDAKYGPFDRAEDVLWDANSRLIEAIVYLAPRFKVNVELNSKIADAFPQLGNYLSSSTKPDLGRLPKFTDLKDQTKIAEYISLAEAIIQLFKKQAEGNPSYRFLNLEQLDDSIVNSGRNIPFSQAVLAKYCEAAKAQKMVWIQVGESHRQQLTCLLKTYLPDNAQVDSFGIDEMSSYLEIQNASMRRLRESLLEETKSSSGFIELYVEEGDGLLYVERPVNIESSLMERIVTSKGFVVIRDRSNSASYVLHFGPDLTKIAGSRK